MNAAVLSIVTTIIDRLIGSTKAKVTTGAGVALAGTTALADIGGAISPEYGAIINAILYLISVIAAAYREKKSD